MKYDIDNISIRMKKTQKMKKVLHILLYIFLIQIILFSVFLIIVELGNSYELPSFLNIDLYVVESDSMNPKLKKNDIVVVKKGYENERYKVGNIITFKKKNGEIVTHRISKTILSDMQKSYITKGDANIAEDTDIVKYENIIGKVIYVMPHLGKIMQLFKNKVFFITCIILLMLSVLNDIRIKKKKLERKKIREKYEKKSKFFF